MQTRRDRVSLPHKPTKYEHKNIQLSHTLSKPDNFKTKQWAILLNIPPHSSLETQKLVVDINLDHRFFSPILNRSRSINHRLQYVCHPFHESITHITSVNPFSMWDHNNMED